MRKQDIKPGLIVAHSTDGGYNGDYAKVLSFDTHDRQYEHGPQPRYVIRRVKSPTGVALLLGYHVTFADHYRPDGAAWLPDVPEYTVEDFDNGVTPPAGWRVFVSSTRNVKGVWGAVIEEKRAEFLARQEKNRLAAAALRSRRDYANGLEQRATMLGLDIRVSDGESARYSNVTMTREQLDSILTELEAHRAER